MLDRLRCLLGLLVNETSLIVLRAHVLPFYESLELEEVLEGHLERSDQYIVVYAKFVEVRITLRHVWWGTHKLLHHVKDEAAAVQPHETR